jgi:hypothetical protein
VLDLPEDPRAPVEIWTMASTPAALASQALAAIDDEKTEVRMSW